MKISFFIALVLSLVSSISAMDHSFSKNLMTKNRAALNLTFGGTRSYSYVNDSKLIRKIFVERRPLTMNDLGNISTGSGSAHSYVNLRLPVSYYSRFLISNPGGGIKVGNVDAPNARSISNHVKLSSPVFSHGDAQIGCVNGGRRLKNRNTSVNLRSNMYGRYGADKAIGSLSGSSTHIKNNTVSLRLRSVQ